MQKLSWAYLSASVEIYIGKICSSVTGSAHHASYKYKHFIFKNVDNIIFSASLMKGRSLLYFTVT